jgi:hypothetical protein
MNLHPSLHKALLAGVARAPLGQDSTPPALQALLAHVSDQARLWHSVAAADLWQRAGYQPSKAAQQLAPACDAAATCPRAAEQVLQLILRGIHPELLPGWLALAAAHNMALPHAALVPLIELGMQKPALRATVAALLGRRGNWLVSQHPAWSESYAAIDDGACSTHWQLGNLAQRCVALQAMRRADPPAALAALQAEWAQEPVENRIALLPCLAQGLSLHDEAFLENALDDKRKEVRGAAQQLLAGLPGSQLAARCKARLAALFTFDQNAAPQLQVALPDACDKAMKRDGIGSQAHQGMGEKAGWLLDLMRCVPPTHWSETWQLAPRHVIAMLARQEFRAALLTGLVQSAALAVGVQPGAGAVEWFVTLIGEETSTGLNITSMLLPDLERLPLAEQERIVQRWLEQSADAPHAYSYALAWAERRTQALAPSPSRLLLAAAQRKMAAKPQPAYYERSHFAALARALDAGTLDYAQANWPAAGWEHWPQWRELVDELMETLHFRHTMQASFLEKP